MLQEVDFGKCTLFDLDSMARIAEFKASEALTCAERALRDRKLGYFDYHDMYKAWLSIHELHAHIRYAYEVNAYGKDFIDQGRVTTFSKPQEHELIIPEDDPFLATFFSDDVPFFVTEEVLP